MMGRRATFVLAALLPLLLLPSLAPIVQGQTITQERQFAVQVKAEESSAVVDYLRSANVPIEIRDISLQSTARQPVPNQVTLSAEVVGNDTRGWTASVSPKGFQTRPGDVKPATLTVNAGATIEEPRVRVLVTVTLDPPGNAPEHVANTTVFVTANPNPVVTMQLQSLPEFRPDQRRQVPVTVTNQDYYPEMVSFTVNAPEGWVVSPPSSVYLAPGETKQVLIDIQAPQDPWFRFNPTSTVISVTAETQTNAGGTFTTSIPAPLSGWFLPGWVIPHIILFIMGAAVIGKRATQKARERRLIKGKPSFPGLPPEKEARYEALKHKDPEKAEEMKERLKQLHKTRVAAWREDYKKRKREERRRRKDAKKRHDAILEKKRKEEKRRREAERRKRKEIKKKQEKREKLRKKRERLEERRKKAQTEREADLAEEMRKKREAREAREGVEETQEEPPPEPSDDDVDEAEAKRKRLEALKKRKRLEELKRQREERQDERQQDD